MADEQEMDDSQVSDLTRSIQALRARIFQHAFNHTQGQIDGRTASILIKGGLVTTTLKNPIPERIVRILADENHAQRWPTEVKGPLFTYRDGLATRGVLELSQTLLNPDAGIRTSTLREIDVFFSRCEQPVSPESKRRLDELRSVIVSSEVGPALDASIQVFDLLSDDYFFNFEGLRQCVQDRIDSDIGKYLNFVLRPSDRSLHFLLQHPTLAEGSAELSGILQFVRAIAETAESVTQALSQYFYVCGHLPFADHTSAAGLVRMWRERHVDPTDPWSEIWEWVRSNRSPLATYHACQILLDVPEWIPAANTQDLLDALAWVIAAPTHDAQWQLRCQLARHYCRHLEALAPEVDGERASRCAWWLAESLAAYLDDIAGLRRAKCDELIAKAVRESDEVWTVARPAVSFSPLRYATLFSGSVWSTAMLAQLSRSSLRDDFCTDSRFVNTIATTLAKPSYVGISIPEDSDALYAFCGETLSLYGAAESIVEDDTLRSAMSHLSSILEAAKTSGIAQLARGLDEGTPETNRIVAHELRREAFCHVPQTDPLWEAVCDNGWRNSVLTDGDPTAVELMCSALIEIQLHDTSHEWRFFLPHFFAMACGASSESRERQKVLFASTVVSSFAVDSVSAIERLLRGDQKRQFEDMVEGWRERIERLMPVAPPWVASKLRGLKSVLYVG